MDDGAQEALKGDLVIRIYVYKDKKQRGEWRLLEVTPRQRTEYTRSDDNQNTVLKKNK